MRGKVMIASLGGVIAVAAVWVALGTAASGSERSISAVQKGTGITLVDADHSGRPSRGDFELGTSIFVDATTGKNMGHGSVFCVQVNPAGTQYQCESVTHFAGGEIVSAGRFAVTSKTYTQAITGGTGVYAGVRGTLRGTWLDARFARARVVFAFHS